MKRIITMTLLAFAIEATASWSKFAHVTSENEDTYKFNISVQRQSSNPEIYDIKFRSDFFDPNRSLGKCAWLIISKRELTPEEQIRRFDIWKPDSVNEDLLVVAKLLPKFDMVLDEEDNRYKTAQRDFELTLHESMINHAYIYIDFPRSVFDGGYYYSIDLATYIENKSTAIGSIAHSYPSGCPAFHWSLLRTRRVYCVSVG